MNFKEKRGLSPVIATVLLISLAVLLAVIVFFWAREFLGEAITKQNREIEQVCENVQFSAEANSSEEQVYIANVGTIPLYGVEIKKKGIGEVATVNTFNNLALTGGETTNITVSGIESGKEIVIVPILLGNNANNYKRAFVCDADYGITIVVE